MDANFINICLLLKPLNSKSCVLNELKSLNSRQMRPKSGIRASFQQQLDYFYKPDCRGLFRDSCPLCLAIAGKGSASIPIGPQFRLKTQMSPLAK